MHDETTNELTHEERLKAIAYQFIALYERWSEDRQLAAKQGAELAELTTQLNDQVEAFKNLEASVKRQISNSIMTATTTSAKIISDKIEEQTTKAIKETIHQLSSSVKQAEYQLTTYQRELQKSQWRTIAISSITTVIASILIAWLVIPSSVVKLTDEQLQDLSLGQEVAKVWPSLPKDEQKQLMDRLQE